MTALDRNSKADTRYLSDYPNGPSVTAAGTDIGQWRTNLTNNTSYLTEASSARTALTTRTLEVGVTATSSATGTVLYHGATDNSAYTYKIRFNGGTIDLAENTILIASISYAVAGSADLWIRWATRADEDSPGDVVHEIDVYDDTAGDWVGSAVVRQAEGTTNATWQLNVGGYGAGVDIFDEGIDQVIAVRISTRYHSRTEFFADWITAPTPDAQTTATRVGAMPIAGALGSADEWAGPALLGAALQTQRADMRLFSPLVAERWAAETKDAITSSFSSFWRQPPGGSGYKMGLWYLRRCALPVGAGHARVRVFARKWVTGGAVQALTLRCYSLARLPVLAVIDEPPPPSAYFYASATLGAGVDHTSSGPGEWVDLGLLRLAPSLSGDHTYLVLAVSFAAGANQAAQRLMLEAWSADPCYREPSASEFGNYGFKG